MGTGLGRGSDRGSGTQSGRWTEAGTGWALCSVVPPGGRLLPSLHPFREKLDEETVKHETWGHSIYLQEKSLNPTAWQERGLGCLLGKSLQMNLK